MLVNRSIFIATSVQINFVNLSNKLIFLVVKNKTEAGHFAVMPREKKSKSLN